MKRILATSVAVALFTLGGNAFATGTYEKSTKADCDSLIQQFDKAVTEHGTAAKLKQAKDMRAAGEKACKAGDYKKGVSDLHMALTDIGVKPAVK